MSVLYNVCQALFYIVALWMLKLMSGTIKPVHIWWMCVFSRLIFFFFCFNPCQSLVLIFYFGLGIIIGVLKALGLKNNVIYSHSNSAVSSHYYSFSGDVEIWGWGLGMVKRQGSTFLKSILFHSLSHFSKAP